MEICLYDRDLASVYGCKEMGYVCGSHGDHRLCYDRVFLYVAVRSSTFIIEGRIY